MNTMLLTGFEPFGGDALNASWEAVRLLGGEMIEGTRVEVRQLPCVFGDAISVLRHVIDEVGPAIVVCAGQASNRDAVCLERVAINLDDARIADNRGNVPIDAAIVAGGPAAYFTSLPVKAMMAAIADAGIPVKLSESAGTYVCNHVFYGLMHEIATQRPALRGGFIHVPSIETLETATVATALRRAIAAALRDA